MAESKGRSLHIQIGDGATAEAFTTIAGVRQKGFSINNGLVDGTTDDSAPWRQLVDGVGLRTVSITVSGVYQDAATNVGLINNSMGAGIDNYRIIDSDTGDYFAGAFQVTGYTESGDTNGLREFSATFESSGTVTFTQA